MLVPQGELLEFGYFDPPWGPSRRMRVYVPTGVDLGKPHATLFLLDGQNVFGDPGSYAGGWHAHDAVESLGPRFWRPVIVAIDNGGVARVREMGSYVQDFLEAVVRDVVPRATEVLGGGGPRVIGGASLGGLAALVGWLNHAEVFDAAIAMSPSLWFAHRHWPKRIAEGRVAVPPTGRLYLDAGRRERGHMFRDAEALVGWLRARGLGEDRLMWRPDARGAHQERHWRRRLPKALRFALRRVTR